MWIEYGHEVEPDPSRKEFNVLEGKARILEVLGLTP